MGSLVRRHVALWHRSRGYGGPDTWELIVSYNNRPLLFRSAAEAWAFVQEACDTARYDFAVSRVDIPVPEAA